MERHLGGSAAAWGRLLASLPTFEGSLCAAIEAAGEGGPGPLGPIPADLRVDLRQLLLLAPPERLAELLPALPPHTVRDLVRFGARLPPTALADVIERATPVQRRSFAKARRARPEVAGALIALGDPALNTAVYLNPRTGAAIRARIMTSTTPLHPTLVARVCNDWAASIRLPALWSGDPLLVRAALLKRDAMTITLPECLAIWQDKGVEGLRPHTRSIATMSTGLEPQPFRIPRYRSLFLITLLRLWERAGAQAALDLVDDLGMAEQTATRHRELLGAPDGMDRLRTEIAGRSCTRQLVRRLHADYLPSFDWPFLETTAIDWDEIRKAHRRRPFTDRSFALLAEQDGCPPELRREAEATLSAGGLTRPGRWPTPVAWADPRPSRWRTTAEELVASNIAAGRTPVADLLTGPRANLGAELLGLRDTIAPDARAARELRDGFAELLGARVGAADHDAFAVVALRLLPNFEGSLAELVDTAAGAVHS